MRMPHCGKEPVASKAGSVLLGFAGGCWFNGGMVSWAVAEPFVLTEPVRRTVPIILSSPHSGRHYTREFLAASRLDTLAIRRSEDSFVDELFAAGPALGMPLLAATFPRAYCDANREPWELDPEMFEDRLPSYINAGSPRVAAGLGTIARIVATGERIYSRKLTFAEAEQRIQRCWRPFHGKLRSVIDSTMESFGACLMIDCHSMPSPSPDTMPAIAPEKAARPPDIILGDGFGTSCAPKITAFAEATLRQLGFTVTRNDPYAGGYITRHYGRPRQQRHALQIEISRRLYMDERRMEKTPGFAALCLRLGDFLATLAEAARVLLPGADPRGIARAAE